MNCTSRCFFLVTLLLIAACQSRYEQTEERLFPPEGWAHSDTLEVSWEAEDTTTRYDLMIDLVHSRDYPYQNLYLEIETAFPSGRTVKDQVNIDLMNKGGTFYGKCGSERCELRVWLQEDVRFGETGTYDLNIYQHTRQDTLPGLYSAAFRLMKHPRTTD